MQRQDYVKLIKNIEKEAYNNINVTFLNLEDNNFDEELIKFNYNLFLKQINILIDNCCNKSIKEQLQDLKREVKVHKEEKIESGVYGVLDPYTILAAIESKIYRIAKVLNKL